MDRAHRLARIIYAMLRHDTDFDVTKLAIESGPFEHTTVRPYRLCVPSIAVEACSRRNFHDHHILYRSRGGDNARDNRMPVCAGHHHHGVHANRIRAWGAAPEAVHWELGVRRDGPPLLCLIGDRYESRDRYERWSRVP